MSNHPTPRTGRLGLYLAASFILCLSFACAGGPDGGGQHAEHEPAIEGTEAGSSGNGAPRIWFITPEDGATVRSPVAFEFGHENFNIEPKGEVHAGAGHHHIGVNTECLPPGTPIPEADPWIHFGDGSATIEMQLNPGEHTFTIQIGDGEHVTLDEPGLCQTISVTVVE